MVSTLTAAPRDGSAWQPARSGNTVSWDGTAVVKRHAAGAAAGRRELTVLGAVADLAVPRVLAGTRLDALRLAYVPGLTAAEAVEAGLASALLFAMGGFLRALQQVDRAPFGAADEQTVVAHGDFAPYNVIVSEDGTTIRAVLDWEAATLADPRVDLAWCGAQFQWLYPRHGYALSQLYAGYGSRPTGDELDAAFRARTAALTAHAQPPPLAAADAPRAIAFGDRTEAAAFAAALSRAVLAPGRHRPGDRPAEIWIDPVGPPAWRVLVSDSAARVAVGIFRVPADSPVADPWPPAAQLVFLEGHLPSLGREDVLASL